jgi:hypothetical protein
VLCHLDALEDIDYDKDDGNLHFMLRIIAKAA